jgi:hypothetical protein
MPLDLRAGLDFLGNAIGRIMVVAGFFLLIASVALFSKAYQWSSIASFVLGAFFIITGAIVHYESPTLKVPSREGWGAILVCVSAVFIASAAVVTLYAVPGALWAMPRSWGRAGSTTDYILLLDLRRPNAWLAPFLAWTGIGLLVVGLLLKFSREIL